MSTRLAELSVHGAHVQKGQIVLVQAEIGLEEQARATAGVAYKRGADLSIKSNREVCMQNYDIRYDDKYGQLAQIDVAAEGAGYEPWVNQTLTSVNDSVVRLAVIEGELVDWHSHEHEDEFFLVLEGKLELEVEGREPFVLGVHQGVTIPRGVLHHPRAHGRTVLLMVEPATVIPTGND